MRNASDRRTATARVRAFGETGEAEFCAAVMSKCTYLSVVWCGVRWGDVRVFFCLRGG